MKCFEFLGINALPNLRNYITVLQIKAIAPCHKFWIRAMVSGCVLIDKIHLSIF